MRTTSNPHERGMALVLVMLITVAVAALAAGAIFLTSSSYILAKGHEREDDLRNAADGGIELGRSALNGNAALFPDSGYATYQSSQPVLDASGNAIPGITRSIYFGPTGNTTGQYGIFGSVVSVISDQSGAVVVRRGELAQESFARYAYYTNSEGSGICFGNDDQIFGPMHTNDNMCIYSSGVHFHSTVDVSGTITGTSYGTFDQGYTQHGQVIPLPTIAQLSKLATYATQGGMNFTAPSGGSSTQSRLRIEFLALDLDGDGRVTGPNEGFFRVYIDTSSVAAALGYATASDPSSANQGLNCGDFHVRTAAGVTDTTFYTAYDHYTPSPTYPIPGNSAGGGTAESATNNSTNRGNAGTYSLQRATSRCYLGGDDHLNIDSIVSGGTRYINRFKAADKYGYWVRFTTTPDPSVIAALARPASRAVDTTLATRTTEAQYLWPLARQYNVNSKGVIYVNGRVVISGVVNSKVTVAASDNVIIGDDLNYAIAPGSVQCPAANMLGLLSAGYIYVSDNVLNDPQPWGASSAYKNYSATPDTYLQGVLLTLNSFTVENYDSGPTSGETCAGSTDGRGCLYINGGIIQGTRGAVGTTAGTGYVKGYSYDQCAFQTPPPYFPTTGRFFRNRYYEIDPVNFNVASFFNALTP
ncbi:MAG TPA: hypothetical protein VEH83_09190 [Gemmatimonadales bacterium]|nr:hypothetical protein [Gemmatimonadales bacterium]